MISVASYWAEVCTELTVKLLVDEKYFKPPKLFILGDNKQIEHQKNFLIIHHTLSASSRFYKIIIELGQLGILNFQNQNHSFHSHSYFEFQKNKYRNFLL